MILDKIIVSDIAPKNTGVVWIKPVDDSYEQYVHLNGKWVKISNAAKLANIDSSVSSIDCVTDTCYNLDFNVETLSIRLPSIDSNSMKSILFYITTGDTPSITITSIDNKNIYYAENFEIKANKTYEINILWNGSAWVVANMAIVVE